MSGITMIDLLRQAKDGTLTRGKLVSDFLQGSNLDLTGGNNNATLTGLAQGVAGDDAVNVDQLNAAIATALTGAMEYKGTIDVTNPDAQLDGAQKGDFFLVSVGGTLDGKNFTAGDHLVVNDDITDFSVDGAGKIDIIDNTESADILRLSDIVNDLTTGGVNDVLSAQQGVVIKALIDALQAEVDATQVGAGLNPDGTYNQPSGSNYLDATTSLLNALLALDAQVKLNEDAIAAIAGEIFGENLVVTNGSGVLPALANIPIVSGSQRVHLNGLRVFEGAGRDYTINPTTGVITFNYNLENPSDCVDVDYRF